MAFLDPEVLHGRLTSGDAGAIAAVAASIADARPGVRDAVRGISDGAAAAVSDWRGSAETSLAARDRRVHETDLLAEERRRFDLPSS